jgi:ActR/RegA family two-component response regulator
MSNIPSSGVLTTGQVARICRVAPRTVSKWFDRGQLTGYKIPGSRDRRIPVRQLVSFMKEHGMPTDQLEEAATSLTLVVAGPGTRGDDIATALAGRTDVVRASTLFEAGCAVERQRPSAIVIDVESFGGQIVECIAAIRANSNQARIVTVGTNGTTDAIGAGDIHLHDPTDTTRLISAVTGGTTTTTPSTTRAPTPGVPVGVGADE